MKPMAQQLGCIAMLLGSMGAAASASADASAVPAAVPPSIATPAAPVYTPDKPAAANEAAPISGMKSLGGERYQIGKILVEKKKHRLTMTGRVLQLGVPLEYLAVSPGGMKGYESLLEIDASGSEFNLACILLGLDSSKRTGPQITFGNEPIAGQGVSFRISWMEGKKRHDLSVPEALYADAAKAAAASDEWTYIGSMMNGYSKRYAADETGVLVTFVRDATAIVTHRTGLGIGAYGSVSGNKSLLPPAGGPVSLTMQVLDEGRVRERPK